MTQTQTQILAMIVALPLEQRRELVAHLYDVNLFAPGFVDRMTPDQQADLAESIAQADRGQVTPSDHVFADLAAKFGFARA